MARTSTDFFHAHASDVHQDDVDVNVPLFHVHEDVNDTQIDPAQDCLGHAHVWHHRDAYPGAGVDARG
jgi:hypothetical protein